MPISPGSPLRRLPRIVIPVAATCTAVLTALPAAAAAVLPLHAAHRGTTAAAFGNHSCDQIPAANQGSGSDGFVFVLPGNDAAFLTLTLTFRTTANNQVTISVPNAADAYPDGITTNGTSKAWVVVPAGWTLLDGSATVDNDATKADDFNLTHTCAGGGVSSSPSPSASPSPSTSPSGSPAVSPSESQTGSPSPGGSGTVEGSTPVSTTPPPPPPGGGGNLPLTGVALTTMTLTAGGLIAAGAALLMVRRRRLTPVFVADEPRPSPES